MSCAYKRVVIIYP